MKKKKRKNKIILCRTWKGYCLIELGGWALGARLVRRQGRWRAQEWALGRWAGRWARGRVAGMRTGAGARQGARGR